MPHQARVVLMHHESASQPLLDKLLAQVSTVTLVGTLTHPSQLFAYVQAAQADLIILDLHQSSMTVMWQLGQIHMQFPTIRSLTCLADPIARDIWGLIAAGVTGYIHHNDLSQGLPDAIEGVQRGGIWCSATMVPIIQRWSGNQSGPHTVMPSPYEMAIVTRVAQGQTNRQIANALEVNERTIRFHLEQLYRRWGVDNRTQAALFAQERGWISDDAQQRQWNS
ncbi:MAG: response regulator transcription factor [Chloroflexota bacterium]